MPKGEKNRKLTDAQRAAIVRIYETQNSDGTWTGAKTIAGAYGVTATAIYNILSRAGVRTRDCRQAHSGGKACRPIKNLPPDRESAPLCKCGCGVSVPWNRRRNGWNAYIDGHYRQDAPYKNREWLRQEYCERNRTVQDIARDCGVNQSSVIRFMKRFGIERRDPSTAHAGRQVGPLNPSWKGGVSKWDYPSAWKRIARHIRKRDSHTCQVCQTQFPPRSKLLHVHHKDGDKFNCAEDNLVSVCATCHPKGLHTGPHKMANHKGSLCYGVTRKGEIFGIDHERFVTTVEIANALDLTTAHAAQLIAKGRIAGRKVGHYWYAERDSFEQFKRGYQRHKHHQRRQNG